MEQKKVGKEFKGEIVKNNLRHILIVFIIVFVLTFLALSIVPERYEKLSVCGDGTFYGTCSLDKPYYCDEGVLVEKASICGCPDLDNSSFLKEGDFCVSEYYTNISDINLSYYLSGREDEILFTVYGGVNHYVSELPRTLPLEEGSIPFRVDFKLRSIEDKVQREAILPLVKRIQNLAPENKVEQARIAISLVQNIPYGASEKNTFAGDTKINYSRYPYEVLYEQKGVCSGKSQLLTFLLKEIGYGTAIFFFPEENHEAVGIKCPVEESFYGSGYCFVETGGPAIITDSSMEFSAGVALDSEPDILLISKGIPLPEELSEYRDAETLEAIRERTFLGILNSWKFDGIKEKYNLLDVYSLDSVGFVQNNSTNETA